jgi:putative DNA primase/helicase
MPRRTDTGNAEGFAACLVDRLRFDHTRKEWVLFDGDHWVFDRSRAVERLLQGHLEARFAATARIAGDEERKKMRAWLLTSQSAAKRRDCLNVARSQEGIADEGDHWDSQPMVLGVRNGVIDLKTGRFRRGTPEDRVTVVTPVSHDPNATCARFSEFLKEIFADDPELPAYLQRVVGYCLTGDMSEQAFWVFFGTGANGKSTLLEQLATMLGPYAGTMPFPSADWTHSMSEYQKAELVGRRLVTAAEVSPRGHLNEELIKALTGGDRINARHPYGRPFAFRPTAKFVLSVNDRPTIRDDSRGMWRRIKLEVIS